MIQTIMTQKYEHVLNVMIDQGGTYPSHVPKKHVKEVLILFFFYSYCFCSVKIQPFLVSKFISFSKYCNSHIEFNTNFEKDCIVWHCNYHVFFVRLYMYKNCQGYGLYSITRVHTSYNTIWLNCLQCPQPLLTDKNQQRLRPYKLFVFHGVSFVTHN